MSVIKKHHTPKYIINRFKQIIFEWRYPEAPWLTKQAVFLLDQLIKSSDIGLEFGSGRSTKWLAKRCNFLTSVEHTNNGINL